MLLLIPICDGIDVMDTRRQQDMEVATLFGVYLYSFIEYNDCIGDWFSSLIFNKPMNSLVNLKNI